AVDEYSWLYDIGETWKVFIRIAQPRLDHFDVWETTVGELQAFGREIKADLTKVFDPEAPFNPGEKQCRFCKVRARCRAKHDFVHAQTALEFDDEDKLPDPRFLTLDEMVTSWKLHPLFVQHYKDINDELLQVLKAGEAHPEVKLVTGITHRRWKDQAEAK